MTIQSKLVEALLGLGYTRDTTARTGKYIVFHWNNGQRLYLGYGGALRQGTSATNSIPVDGLKARLLAGTYVKPEVAAILKDLIA